MMNFTNLTAFILLFFIGPLTALFQYDPRENDASYWRKQSDDNLDKILKMERKMKAAKNVILFIGDGMGISTLTAARILKGQLLNKSGEEGHLFFENFPNSALIKTFNLDRQIPDSAATATALMSGVKVNFETLGVSWKVNHKNTNCGLIEENKIESIMVHAQNAGKRTGIVTTCRVTHATPAAAYAHTSIRYSESDYDSIKDGRLKGKCPDIARQLIETETGSKFNVILGGGRSNFVPKTERMSTMQSNGKRLDGENLLNLWLNKREKEGLKSDQYALINSTGELNSLNAEKIVKVLGLFHDTHMSYDAERDTSDNGEPSLTEMVEKSIQILSKESKGYVLMVEGGKIDKAHHANRAYHALHDTFALDKAVEKAYNMVSLDNTLIIVTADHSHGFVINGYAKRGDDILQLSSTKDKDSKFITTLSYMTGPGFSYPRKVPTEAEAVNPNYVQYSGIDVPNSLHGGEDVALYSVGPMSWLFQGNHDQTYVGSVIKYTSCIGEYIKSDFCQKYSSASSHHLSSSLFILVSISLLIR